MKRISEITFLLSLAILFILSCASNTTKNSGSVATDDDIKAMFENYEYDLNYNYSFILGRWDRSPKAIVGIDKNYALVRETKDPYGYDWTDWQQFEPSSEKLKELVRTMDTGMLYTASVGYKIYAPGGGDQIGIMYSRGREANPPDIRFKVANLIVVKPRTWSLSSGAP